MAWIEAARYSAKLIGDELKGGRVELTARNLSGRTTAVPLKPLNLAFEELRWDNAPAHWGTTSTGESVLLIGKDAGTLSGRWTARGRRLLESVEFDLHLVPATVSRIVLTVPRGATLTSSEGAVAGPEPSGEADWSLWTIEIGSRTRCRLRVSQSPSARQRPLVVFEQNTSYNIQQSGLHVRSDFNLDVADAPMERLVFETPRALEVNSVSLGGEQLVQWSQKSSGERRRLVVRLPDPILGPSQPIRIRATGPVRAADPWTLPRIDLKNALFLEGTDVLKVEPPLRLQALATEGARQTGTTTDAIEGQTITLMRFDVGSRVEAAVALPPVDLRARVFNLLHLTPATWVLETEVEWAVRSGTTFVGRCQIPSGWEITDVRLTGQDPAPTRPASWRVEDARRNRLLTIEFREALVPGRSARVRIVARRLPQPTDRPTALPVIQPTVARRAETLLAVDTTESIVPVFKAGGTLERLSGGSLPEPFQEAEFWQERAETLESLTLFRVSGDIGTESFQVRGPEGRFDAEARVEIQLAGFDVSERFRLSVRPLDQPLKRILVYASRSGAPVTWRLTGHDPSALQATRLTAQAHAFWGLPGDGELWQIDLPEPKQERFELVARRRADTNGLWHATVLWSPTARNFKGRLSLIHPASMQVKTGAVGMTPRSVPAQPDASSSKTASRARAHWSYDTIDDTLRLRWRAGGSVDRRPSYAHARIESEIALGRGKHDLHRIVLSFPDALYNEDLSFELAKPATLTSLSVNGLFVSPEKRSERFVVSGLAERGIEQLEIRYRTPAQDRSLHTTYALALPVFDVPVLSARWRFSLPAGIRLDGTPRDFRLLRRLEGLSIFERLFSPLGRSLETHPFNPLRLFSDNAVAAEAAAPREQYESVAPFLPDEVKIGLRNQFLVTRIAWCCLFAACLAAVAIRRRERPLSRRLQANWIAVCFIAALFLPAAFAQLAGGLLTGTLLGSLLPLRLFERIRTRQAEAPSTLVSTVAARGAPGLLVLCALAASMAQDRQADESAAGEPSRRTDERLILVPHSEDGKVAPTLYVDRELLRLVRPLRPDYLIANARYEADCLTPESPSVRAVFSILRLTGDRAVDVRFPFAHANPGGPDACRVDGKPHPVIPLPGGRDLIVRLPAEPAASDSRPSDQDPRQEPPALQAVEIVFELHPPLRRERSASLLEFRVPPVVNSVVHARFDRPFASLMLTGEQGVIASSSQANSLTATLGQSSRCLLSWSAEAFAPTQKTAAPKKSLCILDPHPSRQQFRFHVDYDVPENGLVDFIRWRLPRNSIVRAVRTGNGGRHFLRRSKDHAQLLVEFDEPQTEAFSVEADVTLPLASEGSVISLPAIDLFAETGTDSPPPLLLGIVDSAEYVVGAVDSLPADVVTLSRDNFERETEQLERSVRPALAFRVDPGAKLTFELTPAKTEKRVEATQRAHLRPGEIGVRVNAEIETTNAAAFQHVLSCDPGWTIDSVSVQEDGAERLAHWSRDGDRLTLFLTDKTTGIQDITINATRPAPVTGTVRLPPAGFPSADVAASTLIVTRDVDVIVRDVPPALEPMTEDDRREVEQTGNVTIGTTTLGEPPEPLVLEVAPPPHEDRIDAVTFLNETAPSTWESTTVILQRRELRRRTPLLVRVPPPLASSYRVSEPGLPSETIPQENGSVILRFDPEAAGPGDAISVSVDPQTSADGAVALPVVTAEGTARVESFLALTRPNRLRGPGPDASQVDVEALPESVLSAIRSRRMSPRELTAYRLTGAPVRVTVVPPLRPERANVPLLETLLWLGRNDRRAWGRTSLAVVTADDETLTFSWPERLQLQAVLLDGRSVRFDPPDSGTFELPVASGAPLHWVVLEWRSRASSSRFPLTAHHAPIPLPADLPVERSLVTIVPQSGREIAIRSGVTAIGSIEHQLSTLEGLIEVNEQFARLTGRCDARSLARAGRALESLEDKAAVRRPERQAKDEKRVAEARRRLDALEKLPVRAPSPDLSAAEAARIPAAATDAVLARLTPGSDAPRLSVWVMDVRALWVALALIGLLVLPRLVRLILARGAPGFFERHPGLAVGLVALVWWLCLRPSALGFALLLVAVAVVLIRRRLRSAGDGDLAVVQS